MTSPIDTGGRSTAIKRLQIIVAAMVGSTVAFLIIAVILHKPGAEPGSGSSGTPIITYIAAAYAAMAVAISIVLPVVIATAAVRNFVQANSAAGPDAQAVEPRLCQIYMTKTIIGAALVEGAALLACMAYIVEGRTMSVVAAGIMIAVLAAQWPTRWRADDWFKRQSEHILHQQQFGG